MQLWNFLLVPSCIMDSFAVKSSLICLLFRLICFGGDSCLLARFSEAEFTFFVLRFSGGEIRSIRIAADCAHLVFDSVVGGVQFVWTARRCDYVVFGTSGGENQLL